MKTAVRINDGNTIINLGGFGISVGENSHILETLSRFVATFIHAYIKYTYPYYNYYGHVEK